MQAESTAWPPGRASDVCHGSTLAERIRHAREAAGLNQSELGRLVGMTPQAVQHWERGGGIKHDTLTAVAQALHVPAAALLFGDGDELQATVMRLLERVALLEARLDLLTGRIPDRRRLQRRAGEHR